MKTSPVLFLFNHEITASVNFSQPLSLWEFAWWAFTVRQAFSRRTPVVVLKDTNHYSQTCLKDYDISNKPVFKDYLSYMSRILISFWRSLISGFVVHVIKELLRLYVKEFGNPWYRYRRKFSWFSFVLQILK